MKKINCFIFLILLLVLFTFTCQLDTHKQDPVDPAITNPISWTKLIGVTNAVTYSNGIAVDCKGNIYVTGTTNGNLDGEVKKGTSDLFVIKYNPNGIKKWTRLLGVADAETDALGIAVDSNGNVYSTGSTDGNLDGQAKTGTRDLFIVKYNSKGDKLWTRLLGGKGSAYAKGISADPDGNIYVTGDTTSILDGQSKLGINDFFLVKYDSQGNKQWTKVLQAQYKTEGYNYNYAFGVAVNSKGNAYTTGRSHSAVKKPIGTDYYYYSFLIKHASNGTPLWTQLLGGKTSLGYINSANGVALDSCENIYITGETGFIDGQVITGQTDSFVVKYCPDGTQQWLKLSGAANASTYANGIAVDSKGNAYSTGYTDGNLDGQMKTGKTDLFIIKYNKNGTKLWTKLLGEKDCNTHAVGTATDPDGNVYSTGNTNGNLDGQKINGTHDGFIVKYNADGVKQ